VVRRTLGPPIFGTFLFDKRDVGPDAASYLAIKPWLPVEGPVYLAPYGPEGDCKYVPHVFPPGPADETRLIVLSVHGDSCPAAPDFAAFDRRDKRWTRILAPLRETERGRYLVAAGQHRLEFGVLPRSFDEKLPLSERVRIAIARRYPSSDCMRETPPRRELSRVAAMFPMLSEWQVAEIARSKTRLKLTKKEHGFQYLERYVSCGDGTQSVTLYFEGFVSADNNDQEARISVGEHALVSDRDRAVP